MFRQATQTSGSVSQRWQSVFCAEHVARVGASVGALVSLVVVGEGVGARVGALVQSCESMRYALSPTAMVGSQQAPNSPEIKHALANTWKAWQPCATHSALQLSTVASPGTTTARKSLHNWSWSTVNCGPSVGDGVGAWVVGAIVGDGVHDSVNRKLWPINPVSSQQLSPIVSRQLPNPIVKARQSEAARQASRQASTVGAENGASSRFAQVPPSTASKRDSYVVGKAVGPGVGVEVGAAVVGEEVGLGVGLEVVGEAVVGLAVGTAVGLVVGLAVVGEPVGLAVVGLAVGELVGDDDGAAVVGLAVGAQLYERKSSPPLIGKVSQQAASSLVVRHAPPKATAKAVHCWLAQMSKHSALVLTRPWKTSSEQISFCVKSNAGRVGTCVGLAVGARVGAAVQAASRRKLCPLPPGIVSQQPASVLIRHDDPKASV